MLTDLRDVKRFKLSPRICRNCGQPIERPEDAELIQDKHREIWYIHTGCANWIREVKKVKL